MSLPEPQDAATPLGAPNYHPAQSLATTGRKGQVVYDLKSGQKTCALPGCGVKFPPHIRCRDPRFCSTRCKNEYWRLAAEIGDRALRGRTAGGKGQLDQILAILRQCAGRWVDRPMQRLPYVLWGTRVSELRRKGYDIRCRRVWREDLMHSEYQYRLYEKEQAK